MSSGFSSFYHKHREIIVYMLFGLVTLVVSFGVYFLCYNLFLFSAAASNAISWVAAVAVAYLTNKPFVFDSHDWSMQTVFREAVEFVGFRFFSGLLETAALFLVSDLHVVRFDGNLAKIITSIFVVLMNYVASKYFIFRNKENVTEEPKKPSE